MEDLSADNKSDERLCAEDGTCAEGPNLPNYTEASNTSEDAGKIFDL